MHILLATDGSAESLEAAKQLARIPFGVQPKITLVTALVGPPHDLATSEARDRVREAETSFANKALTEARGVLQGAFSDVDQVVEEEHPSKLILQTAQERSADLIVLGARGHSAVYRVFLGSTADHVANHAKCSVVIVRSGENGTIADPSNPFRVLLAYDGSDSAKEASRQLCSLEWPSESQVHIAMVLEKPKLIPEYEIYDPIQIAESEESLSRLEEPHALSCQVKHSVRESLHVGNAICEIAEAEGSNLMFIGGTGKSAIARFFLGSVSRFVLHHAPCTLWIARAKQWAH